MNNNSDKDVFVFNTVNKNEIVDVNNFSNNDKFKEDNDVDVSDIFIFIDEDINGFIVKDNENNVFTIVIDDSYVDNLKNKIVVVLNNKLYL